MVYHELNGDGVFWLPERPDHQVAGILSYSGDDWISLRLVGSFGPEPDALTNTARVLQAAAAPRDLEPKRIVGIVGKKVLTLEAAIQTNVRVEWPGILREEYSTGRALIGVHLEQDEEAISYGISSTIDGLSYWLGKSGLSISIESSEPDMSIPVRIVAEYKVTDPETVTISNGDTIECGAGWGMSGDHVTRTELYEKRFLRYSCVDGRSIEDLRAIVFSVQDLLALAVNHPVSAGDVHLYFRDTSSEASDDDKKLSAELVEFGRDERLATKPVKQHSFAFRGQDIGGLDGIAAWIEVAARFRAVLGLVTSAEFTPAMYVENRFANICSAAEALHKSLFPQSNRRLPLHARITELCSVVSDATEGLGFDGQRFGVAVGYGRNKITHIQSEEIITAHIGDSFSVLSHALFLVCGATLLCQHELLKPAAGKLIDSQFARHLRPQVERALGQMEQIQTAASSD